MHFDVPQPCAEPPATSYCVPRQELHTDSPHGPLAFVLSLTEWEGRSITGGETMLFQPHMLDFWAQHDPERGIEFKDMVCTLCSEVLKAASMLVMVVTSHMPAVALDDMASWT